MTSLFVIATLLLSPSFIWFGRSSDCIHIFQTLLYRSHQCFIFLEKFWRLHTQFAVVFKSFSITACLFVRRFLCRLVLWPLWEHLALQGSCSTFIWILRYWCTGVGRMRRFDKRSGSSSSFKLCISSTPSILRMISLFLLSKLYISALFRNGVSTS